MEKHFWITFFLFFSAISFAMNAGNESDFTTEIKGQITDSLTMETIPYVTVKIIAAENPAVAVKVLVTDDNGNFKTTMDKAGDYLLNISFIGKKGLNIPFKTGEKNIDFGKLPMADDAQLLGEVVVSAQKPLVKVDMDKITYSLEDDPDSKTNNVLEMLKKVPMVTVDGEENIQLKGSSNFKFYMNGKPSTLLSNNPKDVLKSIPANTIKDIEVITDPGAKYDAEGVAGIINIITPQQSSLGGYTVSLNSGINSRGMFNGGTYFSVKYGKLGFTGMYNYSSFRTPSGESESFRNDYLNDDYKYLTQTGMMKYTGRGQYGYGELSYEIDTLNLINLSFNRYAGGSDVDNSGVSEMQNVALNPVYRYESTSTTASDYGNTTFGVDYQRTFSLKDRLLTASYRLNLTPNDINSVNRIDGLLNFDGNSNKQFTNGSMKEHTFQLDYTTPFAKIHTWEAGIKYIIRNNESSSGRWQQVLSGTGQDWLPVHSDNDEFWHKHDILAAYTGYSLKYKQWGAKAGLRYEATWLDAGFPLNESHNFDKNYSNLVPSATFSYQIKPAQVVRLGYNMRILRPGITQLNPYINTSDTSYVNYGNPLLDAVISHSISLNYNHFHPKFSANANLSYNFSNNEIDNYTRIEDAISYTTYENIAKSKNINLSLYLNWSPTMKFRIFSNLSGRYADLQSNNESGLANHGWDGSLFAGAQYTLPWNLTSSLNGGYFFPRIGLQRQSTAFYYYNFSLSKSFIQKRLQIRVYTTNPFNNRMVFKNSHNSPAYAYDSRNVQYRGVAGISVSFRFGEMKAQIKKTSRGITNDDNANAGNDQQGSGQQPAGQ